MKDLKLLTPSYNSLSLKLCYLIQYKYYTLFISIRTALSYSTNVIFIICIKDFISIIGGGAKIALIVNSTIIPFQT